MDYAAVIEQLEQAYAAPDAERIPWPEFGDCSFVMVLLAEASIYAVPSPWCTKALTEHYGNKIANQLGWTLLSATSAEQIAAESQGSADSEDPNACLARRSPDVVRVDIPDHLPESAADEKA